ncbi:cholinesterase [Microdochium nivale]|nr:cholinesterase [Microdochium nivale]
MLSKLLAYCLVGLTQLSALHAKQTTPTLNLPWGVYEGKPMKDDANIYLFENVRFGANPVRFAAPEFPTSKSSSVQPVSDGRNCIQVDPSKLDNSPGGDRPVDTPEDQVTKQGEDCLFLDLYVPKAALDAGSKGKPLPVVVWWYGGAFAFGSKNQIGPLYTGRSVIATSKYSTIFVAGNYRLGAFGWLAGDYMQKNAQPNAGLYDQALLFQWVQKYISQVSGDKSQVSAWGESAGAGSILHHLIRENGAVDPTFKTFAVQSPAFEWAWDNRPGGKLDKTFETFSKQAGCTANPFDIDCLRASKNLVEANQALFGLVRQTGLFPVGPAVDGKWITTIPTLAFAQGNYWKSIKSTIISHCLNEAASFIPKHVTDLKTFTQFLHVFLPGAKLEPQRTEIAAQYPCTSAPFGGDYQMCVGAMIQDASFTCNTRDLFSAFPKVSHMMRYGFPNLELAHHAADLVALFANSVSEATEVLMKNKISKFFATLYSNNLVNTNQSAAYQTYFASFAASGGDPNTLTLPDMRGGKPPKWPVAKDGEKLTNVLTVQSISGQVPGFLLDVPDDQTAKSTCAFWNKIAKQIVTIQAATTAEEDEVEDARKIDEL